MGIMWYLSGISGRLPRLLGPNYLPPETPTTTPAPPSTGLPPAPTQGPIGLKSDDDGNTNPEGPVANQQAFRNLEEIVPEAVVKKESGSTPAVPTQGPQGVSLPSATIKLPTSPPQPVPVQGPPAAGLPPAPAQG